MKESEEKVKKMSFKVEFQLYLEGNFNGEESGEIFLQAMKRNRIRASFVKVYQL